MKWYHTRPRKTKIQKHRERSSQCKRRKRRKRWKGKTPLCRQGKVGVAHSGNVYSAYGGVDGIRSKRVCLRFSIEWGLELSRSSPTGATLSVFFFRLMQLKVIPFRLCNRGLLHLGLCHAITRMQTSPRTFMRCDQI